jgi:hypothetical protein
VTTSDLPTRTSTEVTGLLASFTITGDPQWSTRLRRSQPSDDHSRRREHLDDTDERQHHLALGRTG